MKKFLSLLVALVMVVSLTSCFGGGKKSSFLGTWEISKVEYDGVEYTMEELENLGDDSFEGILLVLKEGGKAGISESGYWEELDWEKTESGLVIGEIQCRFEGEYLVAEEEGNALYFVKTSDSQKFAAFDNEDEEDQDDVDAGAEEGKNYFDDAPDADDEMISKASVDELENELMEKLEGEIDELNTAWEDMKYDIETAEDYVDNVGDVAAFYDEIVYSTENMSMIVYDYAIKIAEAVIYGDSSVEDKADEIEALYDVIYFDAMDLLDSEIDDGILDDMEDYFYYDILQDEYIHNIDDVDYIDEENNMWNIAEGLVNDWISMVEEDVYDLYSDLEDDLWDEDIDAAKAVLDEFKEYVKNGPYIEE